MDSDDEWQIEEPQVGSEAFQTGETIPISDADQTEQQQYLLSTTENWKNRSNEDKDSFPYTCSWETYEMLLLGAYPLAVIVIIILAALKNLRSHCCTKGYRALCIFPINLLDGYADRLGYACIFGSMAVQIIDALLEHPTLSGAFTINEYDIPHDPIPLLSPLFKAFLHVTNVVLIVVAFYPLFICISTDYRFAGALLGILCTAHRLGLGIWTAYQCHPLPSENTEDNVVINYNTAFYNAPALLCLVGLTAKYISVAVVCVKRRKFGFYPRSQGPALGHHILHVQKLLRPEPLPWQEQNLRSVGICNKKKLLATFIYKSTADFRLPMSMVATFATLIPATYQIGLMVVFRVWTTINFIQREGEDSTFVHSLLGNDIADKLFPEILRLHKWIFLASLLWAATTGLTALVSAWYIYKAAMSYKKHIYRAYRGEKSLFPKTWIRENGPNIMTNAIKYAGLQVAHFMWGFVFIQVMLACTIFAIVYGLVMPIVEYKYYGIIERLAEFTIIPGIISGLMSLSQKLLTRFIFMQPKINADDRDVPLAVDNRNAFYNFSLLYFFFDVFVGAVSAIMRVLKAMLLGTLYLPKMDRSVMMRGFEHMDAGFMSYLSVLVVTVTHDHPVVRVFAKLLLDEAAQPKQRKKAAGDTTRSTRYRTARIKWHLAYTLLKNPDLIMCRKKNLKLSAADRMAAMMTRPNSIMAARPSTSAQPHPESGHQLRQIKRPDSSVHVSINVIGSTAC